MDKAIVSYETKHPALLPHDHKISHLIMQEAHQCGHTGVATTAAKTRTKYWILRVHDLERQSNSSVSLAEKWSERQRRRLWQTYLIT